MKKIEVSKSLLEDLYLNKKFSMKKISKETGFSYFVIKKRMTEFNIPKRDKYDSVRCSFEQKHKEIGYKKTLLVCPECNNQFYIKDSLLHRGKNHFCSASCSTKYYYRLSPVSPKNGRTVSCKNCGKEVYRPKSWFNHGFEPMCSDSCRVSWMKTTGVNTGIKNFNYSSFALNCYTCKKEIFRTPSTYTERNYCSADCMSLDYKTRFIGPNNPFWKGGWDSAYGSNWRRVSIEIRTRDSFTCQRCLRTKDELLGNEVLHVHHIIPLRLFNGDTVSANNPENLITLCSNVCHPYVEKNGIDFNIDIEGIVQTTTLKKVMET